MAHKHRRRYTYSRVEDDVRQVIPGRPELVESVINAVNDSYQRPVVARLTVAGGKRPPNAGERHYRPPLLDITVIKPGETIVDKAGVSQKYC